MSGGPTTLVIDDGELDTVCALLEELGVEHERWRGSKYDPPICVPGEARLLITTARLAVGLDARRQPEHLRSTWLAFIQGGAKTQRTKLRRAGFDLLVPFDTHPIALRALVLQALFTGRNQQAVPRFSVGSAVRYRTGWRTRDAVLVDLSMEGCRLMVTQRPALGARIRLCLPQPARRRPLVLVGEVVRTGPAAQEGGHAEEHAVGLRFRNVRGRRQLALAELLRERATGPAVYTLLANPGPEEATALVQPDARRDERHLPRARYPREVEAICAGATRALLARDLSENGVRIEPCDRIALRERLRLALYGCSTGEPLLIDGHVERDDGPMGLMIRFDWMEDPTRERLRHMLAELPKIRRLSDDADVIAVDVESRDT